VEATELAEGRKAGVRAQLRQAFLKNGQVPRLSKPEFLLALKEGWIVRIEGQGKKMAIAPTIMEAA